MQVLQNFLFAFAFSFVGSIPPGTINLTALQLGLEKKTHIVWRFAFAASIIEYPYAWLAVVFEKLITSSPVILDNFKLISAAVMIVFGGLNLWSAQRPTTAFALKFQDSGFRRGLALGILNPLAMPYWIAITAYLNVRGWISISSTPQLHGYLFGVFTGAMILLVVVAFLANRLVTVFQPNSRIKMIPGVILLILGIYALVDYLV